MDPRPIHVQNVKTRPNNRTYLSYNLYDSLKISEQVPIQVTHNRKNYQPKKIEIPKDYYFGNRKARLAEDDSLDLMRHQSMDLTPAKKFIKEDLFGYNNQYNPQSKNQNKPVLIKQQSSENKIKNRNSVLSRGGKHAIDNYTYAQEFVYENQQSSYDIINLGNRYRATRLKNFPRFTLEDKCYEFNKKASPVNSRVNEKLSSQRGNNY